MQIIYQERIGPDGELLVVPVIPPTATADEIEEIIDAEGAPCWSKNSMLGSKRTSARESLAMASHSDDRASRLRGVTLLPVGNPCRRRQRF